MCRGSYRVIRGAVVSIPRTWKEEPVAVQNVEITRARTLRRDAWWVEMLPTIILLGGFGIYATWAALVNRDYYHDPYLSPFYSPCLTQRCPEGYRIFGSWWSISPAILI